MKRPRPGSRAAMKAAKERLRREASVSDTALRDTRGKLWATEAEARASNARIAGGYGELSVADRHQLKVALDTLKMPDAMAGVMGGGHGGRGMSKAEARAIVARLTGKAPEHEVSAGAYMGAMFSGGTSKPQAIHCAWCKRVMKHGDPNGPVSHGICPECVAKHE